MKKIKLFCIPYAGGSASIFFAWKKYIEKWVELIPIELSGHGIRMNETLITDINRQVNDIVSSIKDQIDESDYAIFGHSMGSTISYELGQRIQKLQLKQPIHIFFSGSIPPFYSAERRIACLPDDKFIQEIISLGGTPKEIYENRDIMDLYTPILRADYKLLEEYQYDEQNQKLNCDISIFYSSEDLHCNIDKLHNWSEITQKRIEFYKFVGNHFFIIHEAKEVVDRVNNILYLYKNRL